MTGSSVATATRPNPAFAGWLARVLPPGLGRDDRALFRDFAVLGGALFAITSIAYVWTIDWRGMWLAAPFGQLSYLAALACWTLMGAAVFVAVGRRHVADW